MSRSRPSKAVSRAMTAAELQAAALAQEALRGAEQRLKEAARHLRDIHGAGPTRRQIAAVLTDVGHLIKRAGASPPKPAGGGQ